MYILACGKTVTLHLKKRHTQKLRVCSFACFGGSLTFIFVRVQNRGTSVNAPHEIGGAIIDAIISVAIPTISAYTNALKAFRIVRALIAVPLIRYNQAGRRCCGWCFRGFSLRFFGHFGDCRLLCLFGPFSLSWDVGAIGNAFANETVASESISAVTTVAAEFIVTVGIFVADVRVAAFIDVDAHLRRFTFEQWESIAAFALQIMIDEKLISYLS